MIKVERVSDLLRNILNIRISFYCEIWYFLKCSVISKSLWCLDVCLCFSFPACFPLHLLKTAYIAQNKETRSLEKGWQFPSDWRLITSKYDLSLVMDSEVNDHQRFLSFNEISMCRSKARDYNNWLLRLLKVYTGMCGVAVLLEKEISAYRSDFTSQKVVPKHILTCSKKIRLLYILVHEKQEKSKNCCVRAATNNKMIALWSD